MSGYGSVMSVSSFAVEGFVSSMFNVRPMLVFVSPGVRAGPAYMHIPAVALSRVMYTAGSDR
jgi:hypothetical protein